MRCRGFLTHAVMICVIAAAPASPLAAQSWEEVDFIKGVFEELSPVSFAKRREYCGFIGYDAFDVLVASPAQGGTHSTCGLLWPTDIRVVASYHTHGAFDMGYINELPSEADMLSDQALGVDGWIATPGGRLWHVDSTRMIARQVCGVNCLPVAPGFYKSHSGPVAKIYTLDDLVRRLRK